MLVDLYLPGIGIISLNEGYPVVCVLRLFTASLANIPAWLDLAVSLA
jgi:hypothetical protein